MEKLLLVTHLLVALGIIGLILLQQGKGAEAGASFGSGASQTVFGSAGGWSFFSKATALLAALFFATSIGLAVMAKNRVNVNDAILPELETTHNVAQQQEIPATEEQQSSEIPAVDEPASEETPDTSEIPQQP